MGKINSSFHGRFPDNINKYIISMPTIGFGLQKFLVSIQSLDVINSIDGSNIQLQFAELNPELKNFSLS